MDLGHLLKRGHEGGGGGGSFSSFLEAAAGANHGRSGGPGSGHMALVGSLQDKRNRNPNWTDGEIMRFLEILQEDDTLKDLMAQRNKQVFCYVAQRLNSEGADKSWDQCRIKLKNLKSQYRYVKERVPDISHLDLENDDVMKRLVIECQGRGISPSSLKHLRYLKRFLAKMARKKTEQPFGRSNTDDDDFCSVSNRFNMTLEGRRIGRAQEEIEKERSVSPPASRPIPSIKILSDDQPEKQPRRSTSPVKEEATKRSSDRITVDEQGEEQEEENVIVEPDVKQPRLDPSALTGDLTEGQRYIERFNQEMIEQFLEHQRKMQANFQKWELERQRQHEMAMDRWREESRNHEKAMFGMFVQVIKECNTALHSMLKAKVDRARDDEDEAD